MRAPPDPGNANGAPTGAAAETALHDGQQLGSATQPAVQDRSLDEIGAEISSMLGVTDDDPRTRQRHLGICNANHKGGLCALCRRALDPTEPIWRVRVHIAYSFGGQPTYWLAPVCKQCRTDPTVNQWTISTKAYRCDGCGRPVYEARSYYRRALVACCDPCRHKAIALRAKRVRAALRGKPTVQFMRAALQAEAQRCKILHSRM